MLHRPNAIQGKKTRGCEQFIQIHIITRLFKSETEMLVEVHQAKDLNCSCKGQIQPIKPLNVISSTVNSENENHRHQKHQLSKDLE